MDQRNRTRVLLTMGDPAGIGPEICACSMADEQVCAQGQVVLIGDEKALRRAVKIRGLEGVRINRIRQPQEGIFEAGVINLIQPYQDSEQEIPFGAMSLEGARQAYAFIIKALELAQPWQAELMATAPINKDGFRLAGIPEKDHTQIFKKYYKGVPTVSMFHCRELCVFHYTRHMSLLDAIRALDTDRLVQTIEEVHQTMTELGCPAPRIAVAALNPHASDGGMFGREEETYLAPAVRICREKGIQAFGPIPSDAVFYLQRQGQYDCVLSLFHDQGHIACKTYDFEHSVSLTFGLPFMRATVDHGTAYDLAGKGTASYENLKEAILAGIGYCRKKDQ